MSILKRSCLLLLLLSVVMITVSCEESIRIVKVELEKFPDRIVYFVGIDSQLDLSGCTVKILTKGKDVDEYPYELFCKAIDNIDFNVPGIYEVSLIWQEKLVYRIPIQVIDQADWIKK